MKIGRLSFDFFKSKRRDPLKSYYKNSRNRDNYNSYNYDDWASMYSSNSRWKTQKQGKRGLRNLYRVAVALGIFAVLLVIKESPHPWSQYAREGLKVALSTEWNVTPVLDKAVAIGLQTVNMDWPMFHELTNPVVPAMTDETSASSWAIPVSGQVVQEFGWAKSPEDNLERFNPGIDISAKVGSEVKVVQPGTVSRIGHDRTYGEFVLIEHRKGEYALYAGLADIKVAEGDHVQEGQSIGNVAEQETGDPLLHFEVRENDKLVDPLKKINVNTATPEQKADTKAEDQTSPEKQTTPSSQEHDKP